jgi:hypothetical protein
MTKSDDRKLAALVRKNTAKVVKPPATLRRQYDDTLQPEPEADADRKKFFSDMKKREF